MVTTGNSWSQLVATGNSHKCHPDQVADRTLRRLWRWQCSVVVRHCRRPRSYFFCPSAEWGVIEWRRIWKVKGCLHGDTGDWGLGSDDFDSVSLLLTRFCLVGWRIYGRIGLSGAKHVTRCKRNVVSNHQCHSVFSGRIRPKCGTFDQLWRGLWFWNYRKI